MKNKIEEQVLKDVLNKHLEKPYLLRNWSFGELRRLSETTISRTIELMKEHFRSLNVKEINNWVKIMKIKSWDNLLIETKEKQKAEFKKMIEKVLKEEVILIDKKFRKYNKIDNHTIVKPSWVVNKILAKLSDDKEVGK